MVRFEEDKMVIEIKTCPYDAEEWSTLVKALLDLMRNVDRDNIGNNFYAVCDLLIDMMPDYDTVIKMRKP
jgi:hypothetical protein